MKDNTQEECSYHAFGDVTCKYGDTCRDLHQNLDRILIWTRKHKKVDGIKDLTKKNYLVSKRSIQRITFI